MSFESLSERLQEALLVITLKHGDVLVRTSWWRRWRGREEWAVAQRGDDNMFEGVFNVMTGEKLRRFGDMERVYDPSRWPDEVCAAVAKLRLTQ